MSFLFAKLANIAWVLETSFDPVLIESLHVEPKASREYESNS